MENYDLHWTIEVEGPKGWEIVDTTRDPIEAMKVFDRCLRENTWLSPDQVYPVRITSPKDFSSLRNYG